MKTQLLSPIRLLYLAPACLAVSLAGVHTAQAQDLHPDWSRVWNRDAQPLSPGSLLIPANVVVPVTLDQPISSRSARIGDIVTATPVSRVQGDSEFPPGTRFGGVVSQTQPAYGTTPGVLDVDFQSALLPDGTEVPIHGFIASLDSSSVLDQNGHLIARDGSYVNAWKAVGIGGGVGFVLGRLLKTNTLVPTILGAAGAYLYARSNTRRGEDANIGTNTTLGIRLESEVSFPDTTGYAALRLNYLETHRTFQPELYGWNQAVCAPPRYRYNDYSVVVTRPIWISVDPFDYYGCPLVPLWSQRPRGYGGYGYGGYGYGGNRNYYGDRNYGHDRDWNRGWNNSRPITGVYGPQQPVDGIYGHGRPDNHIGSTRPGSVFGSGSFSPSREPDFHRNSPSNSNPIQLPALESKGSSSAAPRSGFKFGEVFGSRSNPNVFREGSSSSSTSRSKRDVFNWSGEGTQRSQSAPREKIGAPRSERKSSGWSDFKKKARR